MSYGHAIPQKIYPKPEEFTEEWRLQNCSQMEENIKKDIIEYSSKLKTLVKKQKKLRFASNILTGSATALSISGTAISSTVVGVIVGGPIVGVGTIAGILSIITLKMEKELTKEIIKNEKLLSLIYYKRFSTRKYMNQALNDGKISEEEFKYLNYENLQYQHMKAELLSSKVSEKNTIQQNQIVEEMEKKLMNLEKKFVE